MGSGKPAERRDGPSDETLALRSREGDLSAFGLLAQRFQSRLYTYALRMIGDAHDAEDLTQEVLLRLHGSLGRYDPTQRLAPWVFGIAAHVCRDWLRRRSRRPVTVRAEVEPVAHAPAAAQQAEAHERRQLVQRAIARLPRKYREVIVLHYLDELAYDQVAAALGITAPAARRRALRAREMLRRYLGDTPEGPGGGSE